MEISRWQNVLNHFSGLLLVVFIFLNALSAFAGPGKTTYQAKIVKPDGYPLEASSVNFKFIILDPAGSCILYSETYSSVNMTSTGGLISFALGSGVKTYPASATTFEQVFSNITPSLSCDTGGPANYSPTATDTRKIVMQFHDGTGWQTLPAMSINAVPYAMYANEATKLNGLQASDFVQVSTVPTCAASEALRYTGASFSCVAVGNSVTSSTVVTALGYTPADGASVTTLTSNVSSVSSTVASVSSTVFSVSSTVTSLQNSVAASFAAITSSQWTTSGTNIFYNTGNIGIGTTTPVTKLDVSGGVRIGAESTTCAPALAGTLRYNASNVEYCNGTSWQAFGVSGAGITNFNGSTSGTQSFATGTGGTAPNIATANGVHTLNIPLASTGSVTAGLISNVDYTTFTNKITSSAASIAQVLGYVPANDAASGTYAQKANNLSDLTNIATARTNLGLGALAVGNSIDLGSASATGIIADARLANQSGVTSGAQYTKVTVDEKGRVTSGAQLSSSDVTTALGYTPANSATIVSSQWTTSGTNIFYNTGNIGIGTTTPVTKLDVSGGVRIGAESTTCAPALAGTLRYNATNVEYCNGTSWQAFGVSSSGLTSLNGSTSQTQIFANATGGTAPAFNTSNGIHTLNIPLASTGSVTAGLISNTDFVNFSNKITSSAASIAQVLGYVPADNAASGTYAQKANNLSDLTNVATARTNLGLGTFATANTVDLGSASATGTLAIARLPSFVGDATIAAASNTIILSNSGVTAGTYTKVTVDTKGRVTSSSALASSDVTTALGYTPASATASTQWTTSGSAIYYNTGNVGIGTAAPGTALDVLGIISSRSSSTWGSGANSTFKAVDPNGLLFSLGLDAGNTKLELNTQYSTMPIVFSVGNSEKMRVNSAGSVGIGTNTPTAGLHLAAGTSSNASLKLTSGTLLTSPQSGTIEYDGANFYLTDGTNTRRAIAANTNPGTYDNVSNINSSGNITMTPTGSVVVSSTTASTNSSTGALVVKGGLGVAGGIYTSGTIVTSSNIQGVSVTATSGIISPYIAGSVASGASLTLDSTTHANKGNILLAPNGGNVGIGTSNPATKLEVAGTSPIVRITDTGPGQAGALQFKDNTGVTKASFSSENTFLSASVSGAEVMRLTSAGNVGIGTSSPGALLDLVSSSNQAIIKELGVGSTAASFFYNVSDYTGISMNRNPETGVFTDTAKTHVGINLMSAVGNSYIAFSTASTNNTLAAERMRINSAGNVGIGTTSPGSALSIKSSTANNTTGDGFTNLRLEYAGGYNAGDMGAGVTFAQQYVAPGTDASTIRVGGIFGVKNQATGNFGGGLAFFRQPAGAANMSEAMRIDQNGNVGIGTSAPAVRFDARISTTDNVSGSVLNSYPITNFINNSSGGGQRGLEIGAPTGGVISPVYLKVKGTSSRFAILNQFDSESLTILDSGNVGIGTTSPNSTLEVSGTLTATKISGVMASIDNRAVVDTPETFNTAGMSLNFKNNSANSLADGGLYNGVFTFRPYGNATDWSGGPAHQLGFTINGNIYHRYGSNTTWNTWRRIIETDNAGNVGIGTTAPMTPLHVVSAGATGWNSIIKVETTAANAHPLIMYRHGGADTGYVGFGDGAATNGFGVYNYLNADLTLGTSSTTMMTFKPSGNVGIGTSSPGSKLSVAGTVESTSGGVKFPDASTQATSAFGPIFASYASTASSTSSSTWVKIPFNAVEFDSDSSVDTTNYRIKPTKAGYYRISMALYLTQTGTGGLTNYLSLYKNGAAIKNTVLLVNYNAGYSQSLQVDTTVYLNGTTDYLEGWWSTNSSNAASLQTGVANTYISGNYIRP